MKIIECPRDAMQGLHDFIPTEQKVAYVNQLLRVGFDTIDVGSFVSPKAVPQMRDTGDVLRSLDTGAKTKLLVIVANVRGATEAARHDNVDYVGYPMSVSETFQRLNTNKSIVAAMNELELIKNEVDRAGKQLVTYLSMAFGNPYGDHYDEDLILKFVDLLVTMGCTTLSIADTVGSASPEAIRRVITSVIAQWPELEIGAHLHASPAGAEEKIQAAIDSGVSRLDGAILGYGGCPMAKEELVGNIATEKIVDSLKKGGHNTGLNEEEFGKALNLASGIFSKWR